MATHPPHGRLRAGEVGELVGVSATTIGQWARRGTIPSSQRAVEPRVYSVEDVAEAAAVRALRDRGIGFGAIRAAAAQLGEGWPLSHADLAVTRDGRPRVALEGDGGPFVLTPRGWQATREAVEAVRLRIG